MYDYTSLSTQSMLNLLNKTKHLHKALDEVCKAPGGGNDTFYFGVGVPAMELRDRAKKAIEMMEGELADRGVLE